MTPFLPELIIIFVQHIESGQLYSGYGNRKQYNSLLTFVNMNVDSLSVQSHAGTYLLCLP